MNYKCPYRERIQFCTHRRLLGADKTTNGRKYCGYKDPFQCDYFLKYYNSLTKEEKAAVMGLKSPQQLPEDVFEDE